jgi:hypothetical protein
MASAMADQLGVPPSSWSAVWTIAARNSHGSYHFLFGRGRPGSKVSAAAWSESRTHNPARNRFCAVDRAEPPWGFLESPLFPERSSHRGGGEVCRRTAHFPRPLIKRLTCEKLAMVRAARCVDSHAVIDSMIESGELGNEIEITPEMIEAGYDALFDDPRFPEGGRMSTCNAVTLAFRAMLRVWQAQSSV